MAPALLDDRPANRRAWLLRALALLAAPLAAARTLKIQLHVVEARAPSDFAQAISMATKRRSSAFLDPVVEQMAIIDV